MFRISDSNMGIAILKVMRHSRESLDHSEFVRSILIGQGRVYQGVVNHIGMPIRDTSSKRFARQSESIH